MTRFIVCVARTFKAEEPSEAVSLAASQLGYKQLKPELDKAVKAFVCGGDVFESLSTGSGKSLCYVLFSTSYTISTARPQ